MPLNFSYFRAWHHGLAELFARLVLPEDVLGLRVLGNVSAGSMLDHRF